MLKKEKESLSQGKIINKIKDIQMIDLNNLGSGEKLVKLILKQQKNKSPIKKRKSRDEKQKGK